MLVMCGAMGCSCMRYGVWDTSHLRALLIHRCILIHGHKQPISGGGGGGRGGAGL